MECLPIPSAVSPFPPPTLTLGVSTAVSLSDGTVFVTTCLDESVRAIVLPVAVVEGVVGAVDFVRFGN